jgi:hypothetical protein
MFAANIAATISLGARASTSMAIHSSSSVSSVSLSLSAAGMAARDFASSEFFLV